MVVTLIKFSICLESESILDESGNFFIKLRQITPSVANHIIDKGWFVVFSEDVMETYIEFWEKNINDLSEYDIERLQNLKETYKKVYEEMLIKSIIE